MKISLAWLFDHIGADWKKVDVENLVDQFNKKVAEIEGFKKVDTDLVPFTLVQVKEVKKDSVVAHSPEWKKDFELPVRADAQEDLYFVVKKDGNNVNWAEGKDWGSDKECLISAVYCGQKDCSGGWKKQFETKDYIFEVDNKSITHRPDMWGHRGFAREIAALLELPFKPIDDFIEKKEIVQTDTKSLASEKHPFTIDVKDKKACRRFAGLYIGDVQQKPSLIWMANRLLRVDSKPINAVVDITNYVMLDMSQPMHAFDAEKITTQTIVPRMAAKGEKLTLLDDQKIELTPYDLIISDGKKPLALAGIMGGLDSGISASTKNMFLESANFDAPVIRRSSLRHKIRTEASMRFEKDLDPNQNVVGIMRLLKLFNDAEIVCKPAQEIASVGEPAKDVTVEVSHQFIEDRLGAEVTSGFIVSILQRLGCGVEQKNNDYVVTVPPFRSSKDVTIKEDIVEEVGRFFGYTNIPYALPYRQMKPFSIEYVLRLRSIKELLAYTLKMREVCNYGFFDETMLQKLEWEPKKSVTIQNPVSEVWQRLATSLIPGLLKNVEDHAADYDKLRFFEWARVWAKPDPEQEKRVLSGIFFDKKNSIDFYDVKSELMNLFAMLKIPVTFKQVEKPEHPWFVPYQTAEIMYDDKKIGTLGKINQLLLAKLTEGDAFIFELDGDFLLSYKPALDRFKPISKFQPAERDISILIPLEKTVDMLQKMIAQVSPLITSVTLLDMFEKPEWKDQKSLTFRLIIQDHSKTLSGDEVDGIWNNVAHILKKQGAQIR